MLAIVALAPLAVPTAYLSPKGDDRNPCSSLKPCVSLERGIATGAKTVILHAGRYPRKKALRLSEPNGGLTIRGEGNAVLEGGITLDHPRPIGGSDSPRIPLSSRSHVRVYSLPEGDYGRLEVRGFGGVGGAIAHSELFRDGHRLPLAGWPNDGWARTGEVEGKDTFSVGDRAKSWGPGGWVHGYWMFDWADLYRPIHQIVDGKIVMGGNAGEYGLAKGRRFRALNLPEELDSPGEWWVDFETNRLYVWGDGSPISLSVLEEPFVIANGVKGLKIENLAFRYGRSRALDISGSSAVVIANCLVQGMGTDGIRLSGAQRSRVEGCDLTDIGETGIDVSGGDRATLKPANNLVRDCHVWNYSQWARTYRPAVAINGVGNRIERCWIHDAPHNGILLGGNDHVIEGCRFERVCRETGDAGAVYMGRDTTMRGVRVEGNYFHDIGPSVTTEGNYTNVIGIYIDDCWAGTTIRRNILDIRGQGVMVGGGRDNVVMSNAFLNNHPAVSVDQRGIGWAKDFFKDGGSWGFFDRVRAVKADQPPYSVKYPPLADIFKVNAARAEGNRVENNVCLGGKWLELLDGLTEDDVSAIGNFIRPKGTLEEARKDLPVLPKESEYGLVARKRRPYDRFAKRTP